jgi:xanthine/uracil permease
MLHGSLCRFLVAMRLRHFIVVSEAALVVMSILILALPEARTQTMNFLIHSLLLLVGVSWFLQFRKFGVLKMTPKETYRTAGDRPMPSLLTAMAVVLSLLATVVPTFR